jgi:hypothetical protein
MVEVSGTLGSTGTSRWPGESWSRNKMGHFNQSLSKSIDLSCVFLPSPSTVRTFIVYVLSKSANVWLV